MSADSASSISVGARNSTWCCASNTRPARKPSWTGPARPCRSATVTPARYGRRRCSSPRSAPVLTPGRRSLATSRWSRGCWRMCMLWNIGAACLCWWFPTTPRRESPSLAVMIQMSIRLIRTSPHTTASACYRRDRISRGTKLALHIAPCPDSTAAKTGWAAPRPPCPLVIVASRSGS